MRQHSAELSQAYRAEGYWTDRLLTDFFESAVKRFPEKVAVLDERFGAVTYSELESIVLRLAAALRARGVAKGDKFVIALPNWHHVSAFLLALGYIGAVSALMPVTGREHEFASVLRVSGAKGIVVPGVFRDSDFVSMIGAIAGEVESLKALVSVAADRIDPGWVTYEQLLCEALDDVPEPDQRANASDITSLLFTSGSSGDPKGVMHSSNTLGALNATVAPLYDLGRATFTLMTPTLLRDLFESEAFPDYADRLSLRLIFCGGSYVPGDLLLSARERLPATLTTVIWGITEGIGTACRPATPQERIIGTDGQPFLGTELRVLKDNGDEARVGEEGELVMRGPQPFLGYFDRPDSDAQVFLPDGWFRTGDVASIDADGFVKITGRLKELIIRGGVNIAPAEIESKLLCVRSNLASYRSSVGISGSSSVFRCDSPSYLFP